MVPRAPPAHPCLIPPRARWLIHLPALDVVRAWRRAKQGLSYGGAVRLPPGRCTRPAVPTPFLGEFRPTFPVLPPRSQLLGFPIQLVGLLALPYFGLRYFVDGVDFSKDLDTYTSAITKKLPGASHAGWDGAAAAACHAGAREVVECGKARQHASGGGVWVQATHET
jgi:hypothetical protein